MSEFQSPVSHLLSLSLSLLQGQLIPEVSMASRRMGRGEERKTEWKSEEGSAFTLGKRHKSDDKDRDASPSYLLMFNHEPVEADPFCRYGTRLHVLHVHQFLIVML